MTSEATHIHHPHGLHTHTAILLHGRGSNGPEFAAELFSSSTSTTKNLPASLPTWRWVFPTARARWSATFQEEMHAWFDGGPADAVEGMDADGLGESVWHVLGVVEREIALLDGKAGALFLGGVSQGMATALSAVLCAAAAGVGVDGRLGGILGFCGYLPFAGPVGGLIRGDDSAAGTEADGLNAPRRMRLVSDFFVEMIGEPGPGRVGSPAAARDATTSISTTPVLLGHGTDDALVSLDMGRQASRILQEVMMAPVEWGEFSGAEGDGHWIKEPEGFDMILRFLERESKE